MSGLFGAGKEIMLAIEDGLLLIVQESASRTD
jgi:hypothetical protein